MSDTGRRQAVALAYEHGDDAAPRVVAKGYGQIADMIVQRARDTGLYVHESSQMVSLLMNVDLDSHVPPLLYQAVVRGQTLAGAVLRWYRTTEAGNEENYFTMSMKDVKIASISPKLLNIKEQQFAHRNHFEIVEFRYGEISWNYHDGNLLFADVWRTV